MSNPATAARASWQQPHRHRYAFAAPIPERAPSSPVPSPDRHPCKLSVEPRCIATCRAPHPTRRWMSNPWSHRPPSPSHPDRCRCTPSTPDALPRRLQFASTQDAAHPPHHLQLRICAGFVRVWSSRGWHEILPSLLARRAPLRGLSSSAPGEEGEAQAENHSSTASGFSIQKIMMGTECGWLLLWLSLSKDVREKHMSSFRRNLRATPNYRDEEVLEEEEQDARSYAGDDMADMHLHDNDDFLSRRVVHREEQHNKMRDDKKSPQHSKGGGTGRPSQLEGT